MCNRCIRFVCSLAAGLLLAGPVFAQLPQVQLPPVQLPQVPGLPETTRAASGTLRELSGARALRVDRLARQHRAELDRVDDALVVRAEVVAIDISPAALERALAERFLLKRQRKLPELGLEISVLQTPEGWSARRGLKRLRKLDPAGAYDFNHVYLDGGEAGAPAVAAASGPAPTTAARRVGLIDGGVDGAHEVFNGRKLARFGCDGKIVPSPHGTAVAAILLSRPEVNEIFTADVFCGLPTGGSTDTIAVALGWMARERVAVINVSLVGSRNVLLERAVQSLVARGFIIVAAVGNDGPAAPPLYPASYDGVVGVTAVDKDHRVLIEACRGSQVDFAAQGTDFDSATVAPATYAPVRGTSFAAPRVTAMLSELQEPDPAGRERLLAHWTGLARDLGKEGRDDVYGLGQLGDSTVALAGPQAHKTP